MKSVEFFELVSDMRDAQKIYFKTRERTALIRSKELEERVDYEIARVTEIIRSKQR